LEAADDDEGAGELDEGEVELGSSFPAGADSAVVVEPGVRAFDWPAFACLGVAGAPLAGSAAADDPRVDPALGERVAEVLGVVAAVGQQRVWSAAPARAPGRDRVDEREQVAALVLVRGA
jgi:hypothetical protein